VRQLWVMVLAAFFHCRRRRMLRTMARPIPQMSTPFVVVEAPVFRRPQRLRSSSGINRAATFLGVAGRASASTWHRPE